MKRFGLLILGLALAVGTVFTLAVPDVTTPFPDKSLARIVFWHLPCALVSAFFVSFASYLAIRCLITRRIEWDIRATAANELGLLLGILTLLTGSLFARVQWQAWWNWDPRQTSYLFAMLFVAATFALRAAFEDPEKRAANSSAYSAAALLPLLFLIFVYPRLDMVKSLHPNVLRDGGFDDAYRYVFLTMLTLIGVLSAVLYRLRVRAGLLALAVEQKHAELAYRDHSPSPRVVRAVDLPGPDRADRP